MDITKAVRSPEKVRATLKRVGDELITLKGCSIIFPVPTKTNNWLTWAMTLAW